MPRQEAARDGLRSADTPSLSWPWYNADAEVTHADPRLDPRSAGGFHDFHQDWTIEISAP